MDQVLMHGNNKTEHELRLALENKIGRIVIDNLGETQLINQLSEEHDTSVDVLLRVKPGVHADSHHYIVTETEDSKFGCNILNGEA